jgi:hypothetical protein
MKCVGEIIANEVDAALRQYQDCVIPIFDVNDSAEPELLGSAVLIEVSGSVFMCTAKHVINKHTESALYFDGPSKFEELTGEFHGSDRLDVAVCQLSSGQTKRLAK